MNLFFFSCVPATHRNCSEFILTNREHGECLLQMNGLLRCGHFFFINIYVDIYAYIDVLKPLRRVRGNRTGLMIRPEDTSETDDRDTTTRD